MILHILRALFVLVMVAIGYQAIKSGFDPSVLSITLVIGVVLVCVDILAPRRKLAIFSGTFLGLVVGLLLAYSLSFVVKLVADIVMGGVARDGDPIIELINLINGAICCFLAISFVLQTKDDFRFIIPYVEFRRQTKGVQPMLLDTSALVDGRIIDLCQTNILESQIIVPRFVLQELQTIADSGDRLKRNRGRRGLDVLQKLQNEPKLEVILYDSTGGSEPGVDQKLVRLAKELEGRLMTTDFNLIKVAQLAGVVVVNLNDVASALRPTVLPGERLVVRLVRPGEESGQGVGFLEDGTMVVVENGRPQVGNEVEFTITNTRQTSAGRMIFGRLGEAPSGSHGVERSRRSRGRDEAPAGASE